MKRNIELLTKVRDLVQETPEKLDMGLWAAVPKDDVVEFKDGQAKVSCGTTACVAGWTVQLAGDKLLVSEWTRDDGRYIVSEAVAKNGRVVPIDTRARNLLGLTYDEADILFLCDEPEVVPYLNQLIAGEQIDYNDDDLDEHDDDDIPF